MSGNPKLGWKAREFILALLLLIHPTVGVQPQDIRSVVDRILTTPQSRDGQMVDSLVQLGRPAVPVLIERLANYSFPMAIVEALGRIGDEQATPALLKMLRNMEPFARAKGEFHAQRTITIAALREIGDRRAETLLGPMFLDDEVHIGTRLAAATALVRLGSPDVKEQARAFIMKVEEDARAGRYGNLYASGPFNSAELDQALFEVGTDECRVRLIDRLMQNGPADEKLAIIHLLAKSPDQKVAGALLEFAEKQQEEPYILLQAAKALVGLGLEFPRERVLNDLQHIRNHASPEFWAEIDKVSEQIRTGNSQ